MSASVGVPESGLHALWHPRSDSDDMVLERTFSGFGRCVCVFLMRRKTMKVLKWDGDGFLMYTKRLSQGRFREVLRNGDSSVRRLQWDDFYLLMKGLTPVKVTVENRFRMAVK